MSLFGCIGDIRPLILNKRERMFWTAEVLLTERTLKSAKSVTVWGSAIALMTNTRDKTHTLSYMYRHTLNREHRSSRWALSWLTVTHWWEQNSTRFCIFTDTTNTDHYQQTFSHSVKQPLLWAKKKSRVKKHPFNASLALFPHIIFRLDLYYVFSPIVVPITMVDMTMTCISAANFK